MKIYHIAVATISFLAGAGSALDPKPALRRNLKGEGNDGCPVGKSIVFYTSEFATFPSIYPANNPRGEEPSCSSYPPNIEELCRGDTTVIGPAPLFTDINLTEEAGVTWDEIGTILEVGTGVLNYEASGTFVFEDKSEVHYIGFEDLRDEDGLLSVGDLPILGGTGAYESAKGDVLFTTPKPETKKIRLCLL